MFLTFKLGKQFYLFPNLCISNFRWGNSLLNMKIKEQFLFL